MPEGGRPGCQRLLIVKAECSNKEARETGERALELNENSRRRIHVNTRPANFFSLLMLVALTFSCGARVTFNGPGSKPFSGGNPANPSNPSNPVSGGGGGKTSMAGTWNGTINCEPGGTTEAVYRVSDNGNPIYDYQTKSGARQEELTSTGQVVRFVPPGGGVASVQVSSLSVGSDQISYSLNISEERTSNDTLDQNRAVVTSDARLTNAGLEVELTVRAQGIASQPDLVVPGEEQSARCRGTLQKQ